MIALIMWVWLRLALLTLACMLLMSCCFVTLMAYECFLDRCFDGSHEAFIVWAGWSRTKSKYNASLAV